MDFAGLLDCLAGFGLFFISFHLLLVGAGWFWARFSLTETPELITLWQGPVELPPPQVGVTVQWFQTSLSARAKGYLQVLTLKPAQEVRTQTQTISNLGRYVIRRLKRSIRLQSYVRTRLNWTPQLPDSCVVIVVQH